MYFQGKIMKTLTYMVLKFFKQVNPNKSSGPDDLSPIVMKGKLTNNISDPYVFNKLLQEV